MYQSRDCFQDILGPAEEVSQQDVFGNEIGLARQRKSSLLPHSQKQALYIIIRKILLKVA